MSYTSKQAAQESQRVEGGANKVVSPKFTDQRASTSVQLKQQQLMNAVQRAGVEEDPMQGKFATVQRAEEEELLQGKFETAQLAEEEELLQGKFATAQLAGLEEEPLQGKFETTQLAEEEELLQGKFNALQRVEDGKLLQGKFTAQTTVQLEEKPNNTGLPGQLKAGIESLSGMSMDGVKVHYNSDKPAQLNAHAYAQGTDIHIAPGQEKHLPHEAWHVVQQAQGRVKPTTQMKGTSVNDDVGLETEADVMGAKAHVIGESSDLLSNKENIALSSGGIPKTNIQALAKTSGLIQQRRLQPHEQTRLGLERERLEGMSEQYQKQKKEVSTKLLLTEQNMKDEEVTGLISLRQKVDEVILQTDMFFSVAADTAREAIASDSKLRKLISYLNEYEFSGGKNALLNVLQGVRKKSKNFSTSPVERNDMKDITSLDEKYFAQYLKMAKSAITVYRGDGRGMKADFLNNYQRQDVIAGGTPDITFAGLLEHTHTNTLKNGMVSTTTDRDQAKAWAIDANKYGVVYEFKLTDYIHVGDLLSRRAFKNRFAEQKEVTTPGNISASSIVSVTLYGQKEGLIKRLSF